MAGLQGPSLQGPGSQNSPDPYAGLAQMIRSLSGRLDSLERGAPLRAAGISVAPEGMTINSALTIDGALDVQGALTLKPGIIGNDALTNPLFTDGQTVGLVGSSIGTAFADTTVTTLNVPLWATRGIVTTTGVIEARDTTTGGLAFCEARMRIGGQSGQSLMLPATAGASVYLSTGSVTFVALHPAVVGGGTIQAGLQLRASNAAGFSSWKCSTATSVVWTR